MASKGFMKEEREPNSDYEWNPTILSARVEQDQEGKKCPMVVETSFGLG